MGKSVASTLGLVNSSVIMPINLEHHFRHSEHIKELKQTGPTRTSVPIQIEHGLTTQ